MQPGPQKLDILFLAANPTGTGRLSLDEEIRAISQKIRQADGREEIAIVSAWAVRPDDLLQYLNQYRPTIVHFSGHGSQAGELILVDDRGDPKPVSPRALTALFRTLRDNVQVVVLNACYSKTQGSAIAEVIDYVVGMRSTIDDDAATAFASSFYRALAFGRTVRESFDQARTSLLLEGIPQENVPELLIKSGLSGDKVLLGSVGQSEARVFAQWRKVFDRPAFRVPCIGELFIDELLEAIDDTQAALNTGRLYSRSGHLLAELPEVASFKSAEYSEFSTYASSQLTQIKRLVAEFDYGLQRIHPGYAHHRNFFAMFVGARYEANQGDLRWLVRQMDKIDHSRNEILLRLNLMLGDAGEEGLPIIELSSTIIRRMPEVFSRMGLALG